MSYKPYLFGFFMGVATSFVYIFLGEVAAISFFGVGVFTTLFLIYEDVSKK